MYSLLFEASGTFLYTYVGPNPAIQEHTFERTANTYDIYNNISYSSYNIPELTRDFFFSNITNYLINNRNMPDANDIRYFMNSFNIYYIKNTPQRITDIQTMIDNYNTRVYVEGEEPIMNIYNFDTEEKLNNLDYLHIALDQNILDYLNVLYKAIVEDMETNIALLKQQYFYIVNRNIALEREGYTLEQGLNEFKRQYLIDILGEGFVRSLSKPQLERLMSESSLLEGDVNDMMFRLRSKAIPTRRTRKIRRYGTKRGSKRNSKRKH